MSAPEAPVPAAVAWIVAMETHAPMMDVIPSQDVATPTTQQPAMMATRAQLPPSVQMVNAWVQEPQIATMTTHAPSTAAMPLADVPTPRIRQVATTVMRALLATNALEASVPVEPRA